MSYNVSPFGLQYGPGGRSGPGPQSPAVSGSLRPGLAAAAARVLGRALGIFGCAAGIMTAAALEVPPPGRRGALSSRPWLLQFPFVLSWPE